MKRRDIKEALKTCGFTDCTHRDFIVYRENFNWWGSFTLVDFDALATLRTTTTFDSIASQLLRLSVLKRWIEDKNRMKERHLASQFRQDMDEYSQLYQAFVTAQGNSNRVPHGPPFSMDDWIGFETGTKDYLSSILG